MLAVVVYRMAIPTACVHVRGGGVPQDNTNSMGTYMLGVMMYRMAAPTAWVKVRGGGVPHGNTYSMGKC